MTTTTTALPSSVSFSLLPLPMVAAAAASSPPFLAAACVDGLLWLGGSGSGGPPRGCLIYRGSKAKLNYTQLVEGPQNTAFLILGAHSDPTIHMWKIVGGEQVVVEMDLPRKNTFSRFMRAAYDAQAHVIRFAMGLTRAKVRIFDMNVLGSQATLRAQSHTIEISSVCRSVVAVCWSTNAHGVLVLFEHSTHTGQIYALAWDLSSQLVATTSTLQEEDNTEHETIVNRRVHDPIPVQNVTSSTDLLARIHTFVPNLHFNVHEVEISISQALEFCRLIRPDVANTIIVSPWREVISSQYVGSVDSDGQPHGHGSMWLPDEATIYTGQWNHGERHGRGVMQYEGNNIILYDGTWRADRKCGENCIQAVLDDKLEYVIEKFRGQFDNDKREGFGVLEFVSRLDGEEDDDDDDDEDMGKGGRCEGFFKNGYLHGYVRRWYADGSIAVEERMSGLVLSIIHPPQTNEQENLTEIKQKCWCCARKSTSGSGDSRMMVCEQCGFQIHASCGRGIKVCPFSCCSQGGIIIKLIDATKATSMPTTVFCQASSSSSLVSLATPPRTNKDTARDDARREAATMLDSRRALANEQRKHHVRERIDDERLIRRDLKKRKLECDAQLREARLEKSWLDAGVAMSLGVMGKDAKLRVAMLLLEKNEDIIVDMDEDALSKQERGLFAEMDRWLFR